MLFSTMHLLLVEDDSELARQTGLWLREAGHSCAWREKGGAALVALGTENFDAVILDVGLPDMDGFTVVEQMRVRGIVGVEEFEGEDGKTYARPIFADPEPTKH
jgi:DNA-binding response OmpR family regulator